MSEWQFASDKSAAARQQKVLGWLKDRTGYVDETVRPTLERLTANILFVGPPGTGKDRLMSWLVKIAVGNRKSVLWFSGPDLFAAARDSMKSDGGEQEFVAKLLACDYLALSDPAPPGANLTEFQVGLLYRIFDRRGRMKRPTWVTVNAKDNDESAARFTPQVWDRMWNEAAVLNCVWKSFRRPAEII